MIEITDEMVAEAALAGLPPDDATSPAYVEFDLRAAIAAVAPLIAAQAAAAEREECTRIAERRGKKGVVDLAEAIGGPGYGAGTRETAEYIARAIRARGDKP